MSVIEFNEVMRAYQPGRDVLSRVSFKLEQGEVLGLLGVNGAGKTTLIRIAIGMLAPQSGSVRVFGLDPRQDPLAVKRRVGYVSEDQILPEFLRVGEVIRIHREIFPDWDEGLERQLGERFDMDYKARIRDLSKGQARQVALLCAVAHRPALLLLDEPAGGLDPAARREFLETAIMILNEAGTTILFSSHHMSDVERMAGRVVILHGGHVILDNELDELREAFSLALVPHGLGLDRMRVLALEGCLAVRDREDALHAILRYPPDQAQAVLARELGVTQSRCASIPLEEMFIELVGGQRAEP